MEPVESRYMQLYRYLSMPELPTQSDMLARAIAAWGALGQRPDVAHLRQWGIEESAVDAVASAIDGAYSIRHRAYAPYSCFPVGASVLDAEGRCWYGTNVENASYGLALCAERAALAAARAGGAGTVMLVCVVASLPEPVPPCGACRQWIAELAPTALVAMMSTQGSQRWVPAAELLPYAFRRDMVQPSSAGS